MCFRLLVFGFVFGAGVINKFMIYQRLILDFLNGGIAGSLFLIAVLLYLCSRFWILSISFTFSPRFYYLRYFVNLDLRKLIKNEVDFMRGYCSQVNLDSGKLIKNEVNL